MESTGIGGIYKHVQPDHRRDGANECAFGRGSMPVLTSGHCRAADISAMDAQVWVEPCRRGWKLHAMTYRDAEYILMEVLVN